MLKFSNFRLVTKACRETEEAEKFTLVFEDVLYGHKLTVKCEEDVYEAYDVGAHLSSGKVLRQSTIEEKASG